MAGRVSGVSGGEAINGAGGSSFASSPPSCLLYSDACSQSVQEEEALVGSDRCPRATEARCVFVCVCVRQRFLWLINLT